MVSWRAFLVVLLVTTTAAGEFKTQLPELPELKVELTDIPAGEDKIVPVRKGTPAPYAGQLFSDSTALRWGNWLEQYRLQVPLLLKTQETVCLTEIKYRDDVLVVHREASMAIQGDLRVRLERVEEKNAVLQAELAKGPAWYNSRGFGIIVGAVGAFGMTALSVWALNAAAK